MKFIVVFITFIIIGGCSEENPSSDLGDSSAIQVTDFIGSIITLDRPAKRIIALAPHIVENVFTAGAGDQLIGVVTYSDYPEQAKSLPIVGGYTKVNLEKVIELNPDLIITWQSNNSDEIVAQIKQLGFAVYVDQPKALEDVAKSIRDIGLLSGHSKQANAAADDYLAKINEIKMDALRNRRLTYLQVYGNIDDELAFKLVSENQQIVTDLKESYPLESDGTLGLPFHPEMFTIGTPCLSNIDINSEYGTYLSNSGLIQAQEIIKMGGPMNGLEALTATAGRSIQLEKEFQIATGNTIQLLIQPCKQ